MPSARSRSAARKSLLGPSLLLLLVACGKGDQNPAPALRTTPAVPETNGESAWVTLVTGDRVRLETTPDGRTAVEVAPARTRTSVQFVRRVGADGALSIIPADALPLLAAGRLDPRLFDVSLLRAQGLGDGGRSTLPLIVMRGRATGTPLTRARIRKNLESIGAQAVELDKQDADAFWAALTPAGTDRKLALGVEKIWLDGKARISLAESAPQIGAPSVWAEGFTGAGVDVAVLDTGILADHPDFADRIAEAVDFTDTQPNAADDVGHGTHCAGIVAGSGEASDGRYRGVAPDATLWIGRVCQMEGCPESAIIAGMEWAAAHARIVSMSFGMAATSASDPMTLALDALSREHGTLFVVAAGNDGDFGGAVSSPSIADTALSVASVSKADLLSGFSSRGPRPFDHALKPDLAAPGEDIVSTRAPGSLLGDDGVVDAHYQAMSGTSMATPHVAGAAALLAEAHPDWDGAELKAALMGGVATLSAEIAAAGSGRLDVARALAQAVHAETGSLSFPASRFPHEGAVAARTLTYHNTGDADASLHLAFERLTGPDSELAASIFRLDETDIVVPAKGKVDVAVHADPSTLLGRGDLKGTFAGHLVASSADGTRVVTAVGLYAEEESYDLTIQTRARGQFPYVAVIHAEDGSVYEVALGDDGRGSVRLPRGTYHAVSSEWFYENARTHGMLVVEPEISVTEDRQVVLDVAAARPITARVDRAARLHSADFAVYVAGGGIGMTYTPRAADDPEPYLYASPVRVRAAENFEFRIHHAFKEPAGGASPVTYSVLSRVLGEIPERLHFRYRDRDLARVDTRYVAQGTPTLGRSDNCPAYPGDWISFCLGHGQEYPAQRVEFYSPAPELSWTHWRRPEDLPVLAQSYIRDHAPYEVGRSTRTFGRAPLSPSVRSVRHDGEALFAMLGLFSGTDPSVHTRQWFGSDGVSGMIRLLKDGVEIARSEDFEHAYFPEASGAGRYALHARATRAVSFSALGTEVDATWHFDIEDTGSDETPETPALLGVRVDAPVDDHGRVPQGLPIPLALRVSLPGSEQAALLRALTLSVSFDDGASFREVPVLRRGNEALALVIHPQRPGFASLRIHARDAAGNAIDQTTLRAYQFGL